MYNSQEEKEIDSKIAASHFGWLDTENIARFTSP